MNFLADESVDRQIVEKLRYNGHNVLYILEIAPGISDEEVLSLSSKEGNLLITADKDFGEIIFRQKRFTFGIILLRLAGLPPDDKAVIVSTAVSNYGIDFKDSFTVITQRSVRIRRRVP
jgi:predicted nuclease of predicted toxin-antitoxin system